MNKQQLFYGVTMLILTVSFGALIIQMSMQSLTPHELESHHRNDVFINHMVPTGSDGCKEVLNAILFTYGPDLSIYSDEDRQCANEVMNRIDTLRKQ